MELSYISVRIPAHFVRKTENTAVINCKKKLCPHNISQITYFLSLSCLTVSSRLE